MPVGNGFMFRARSERDAETFLEEMRQRGGRGPRLTRRQRAVVITLAVLVLAAWGVAELLA